MSRALPPAVLAWLCVSRFLVSGVREFVLISRRMLVCGYTGMVVCVSVRVCMCACVCLCVGVRGRTWACDDGRVFVSSPRGSTGHAWLFALAPPASPYPHESPAWLLFVLSCVLCRPSGAVATPRRRAMRRCVVPPPPLRGVSVTCLLFPLFFGLIPQASQEHRVSQSTGSGWLV